MTKKKTSIEKEVDTKAKINIPTGFRLTNDTRSGLVNFILKIKFGKRTEELLNQEIDYVNYIIEYLYPIDKKNILKQGTSIFYKDYNPFTIEKQIAFDGKEIGIQNIGYNLKNDKDTIIFSCLLGNIRYAEIYSNSGECSIPAPKREYTYSQEDVKRLLPQAYYNKILTFIDTCKRHVEKRKIVRESLEALLLQYTSAKKLCEDHDEFISWINQYANLPPKCTDIGTHDLMQEIRQTCKAI